VERAPSDSYSDDKLESGRVKLLFLKQACHKNISHEVELENSNVQSTTLLMTRFPCAPRGPPNLYDFAVAWRNVRGQEMLMKARYRPALGRNRIVGEATESVRRTISDSPPCAMSRKQDAELRFEMGLKPLVLRPRSV
jgi:hypothetical protein